MTTDDESSTKEEPESEPGTFVINGEEFTAKEFTEITTRTGDACDVDFCQHCGLAYNPAEQGWYVDRNDIGPDADGETARLSFHKERIPPFTAGVNPTLADQSTDDTLAGYSTVIHNY